MYVYIIQSGISRKAPLKIGVSDDPEKRVKQLQTGNPEILKILTTIKCKTKKHAYVLEGNLHRLMSSKGILNEWFSCSKDSVLSTINRLANNPDFEQVKKYEDIIKGKTKETVSADAIRKKALNGALDDSVNAMRNKIKAQSKALNNAEAKLSKRRCEAGIMRAEMIKLGFTGEFDLLLGRTKG